MLPENIALIEFGGSHDECLYSQVLFLKKYNYRVHLLLFEDHYRRINLWPEVDNWQTWLSPSGKMGEWKLVFKILKFLRRNNISKAVINTAEGNTIRKLSIASGKKIEYIGIIHLARKLWTSGTQKIISRKIKKYFVLADFINENLGMKDPGLDTEFFYPVFFPKTELPTPEPENRDFLVCVPGAVDFARRDYNALMDEIRLSGIPTQIRFMLLGRTTGPDGKNLISRIRADGLEKQFITFEGFLDYKLFYENISISDLILPLITPGSFDYNDYLNYKVTGSYNLAWGFQRPMLMHDSFSDYRIFRETSVFFRSGEMMQAIEELAGQEDRLGKLRKNISGLKDFDFDVQAEKYVNFIRG
ncbi:hypothetical protein ACFLTU_01875 [Bacteroidota bacterium]